MRHFDRLILIQRVVSDTVAALVPNGNAYLIRVGGRYVVRIHRLNRYTDTQINEIYETISRNFCESLEHRATNKTFMDFYVA